MLYDAEEFIDAHQEAHSAAEEWPADVYITFDA